MKTNKMVLGVIVAVVVVIAGAAFYFTSGDNLQGRFSTTTTSTGSSSDTRTTCDYSSDTSVANIRECIEDILGEYRSVEDENFNLIYEKLGDMEEMMDNQWTLLLGLVEEVDAIENAVTK